MPTSAVSSSTGQRLDDLIGVIEQHRLHLAATRSARDIYQRTQYWIQDLIRERFDTEGLERALPLLNLEFDAQPFSRVAHISTAMRSDIGRA